MELTEYTFANLLAGSDRILSHGFGYCMLVGATGQGTRLLRDDPEEPLTLAEMIQITNQRHIRIWWFWKSAKQTNSSALVCLTQQRYGR